MSNNIATKLQAILSAKGDIKDAIEGKGVTVGSASLDQYASKIGEIPAPIVEAPENDVNFYDYDGFRVASYTITEAKALTALPTPPTHEGLTFQEWNWTLADIQGYNRRYIDVGACYIPTDEKTHIKITAIYTNVGLRLAMSNNANALVEWGDGNTDTLTATGDLTHTYSAAGTYDIKVSRSNDEGGINLNSFSDKTKNFGFVINELNIGSYFSTNQINNIGGAPLKLSVNKNCSTFSCGSSKFKQITIPRNENISLTATNTFNGCHCKICFPKTITSVNSAGFVASVSQYKLVIPEWTDSNSLNTTWSSNSTFCILSLPQSASFQAVTNNKYIGSTFLNGIDIVQGWIPQQNMDFSNSTQWFADALVDFFNKLGTTTNAITLTFGSTNLDKLTAEEKAIATNKGYTLA